ncbi:substrate-binding domain-containing protein [Methylobacterium sp. PvR107]|uniref:substrate-binding domain-containing protein n=1 Tax=Methylobacterium sp. PvR107 TaxID=2806597 RepID=UPI001AE22D2B|nr:substrate-binding domain-containing protein [Methylobacterium sp. PvR107]MBP1182841.1 ribose transport system substrate-binding protein/inositol transport system substrate-binding protein [Methylobacterium sp. PvR107]
MSRTRHVRVLARICAAALAALACGADHALATTLGIAMTQPVGSMQLLHDSLEEHARARSLLVRFAYAPEGAGAQQIAQVRDLIAAKVDALLVMPVEPAANAAITRLAQEADIPLVYVNDGPREDWLAGRVALVIPNELVAGRLQMRKLAQMMNGSGRLAIISGNPARAGSVLRTRGVKAVMAEVPGLQLVAEGAADWDRGTARTLVSGWLAQGMGIDAIAANNDAMAIGAAEAVEAAGLPAGRILIGGIDATADGMLAMQRKRLAVTVHQDATLQGRRAIDDALALIAHRPVQQYDWMPCRLVTDRMSTMQFSK